MHGVWERRPLVLLALLLLCSACLTWGCHTLPVQLVFGGRDDEAYFSDVWLLDLATIEWRLIEPASALAPAGRDHHSAAYLGGKMFIYGALSPARCACSLPAGVSMRKKKT